MMPISTEALQRKSTQSKRVVPESEDEDLVVTQAAPRSVAPSAAPSADDRTVSSPLRFGASFRLSSDDEPPDDTFRTQGGHGQLEEERYQERLAAYEAKQAAKERARLAEVERETETFRAASRANVSPSDHIITSPTNMHV